MPRTYDDLRILIGFKCGYCPNLTMAELTGNKLAIVNQILVSGLARFSHPVKEQISKETHRWSFTTPTITLNIPEGSSSIPLPAYYVDFKGPLCYAPGNDTLHEPIALLGEGEVLRRQSGASSPGRPCIGGVRPLNTLDLGITAWELVFYPTADADYQVKAPMQVNPTVPGDGGHLLLGGTAHENTIIEACRAEAEALLDDLTRDGQTELRFQRFLEASIATDLRQTAAKELPRLLDPGLGTYGDWQRWNVEAWCGDAAMEYVGASAYLI